MKTRKSGKFSTDSNHCQNMTTFSPMGVFLRTFIIFILVISFPMLVWGWNFTKHIIPLEDIMSGGPPKDGIPALLNPNYLKAKDADYMRDDESILGVHLNGIARAYPTRILSWHESVNDKFGDLPVLVSW
jgi:hypothetical protein